MKKIACIILSLSLLDCAAMKKHPVITSAVIGIAAGATVAIIQNRNGSCPSTYDGHPYSGTPPCPK